MHRWLQYVGVAVILVSFYLMAFSASDVYDQQIISGTFYEISPHVYVSPEVNIWIESIGQIEWSSTSHSVQFYLIPASRISRLSADDASSLAVPPIEYVGGPNTYLYQDLHGSYYVVAISSKSPSGCATYIFSHPPYVADELVGGPNDYSTAQHVLIYSILLMFLGFSFVLAEPAILRSRDAITRGDSLHRSILRSSRRAIRRLASGTGRHRAAALVMILIIGLSLFTVVQYESVPKVIPVLPSDILSAPNLSGNYNYNFSFWAYSPGVSAQYHVVMFGPLPKYGEVINSSLIYQYSYGVNIIKTRQVDSLDPIQQALLISNVTVSIGNYSIPFHENAWDIGLVYFNGGIVTNQYGTFDTGNEFGLAVDPVNEVSCSIPNGNYTMVIHIELYPVSVLGPNHVDGSAKTITMTFPVEVNNNFTV